MPPLLPVTYRFPSLSAATWKGLSTAISETKLTSCAALAAAAKDRIRNRMVAQTLNIFTTPHDPGLPGNHCNPPRHAAEGLLFSEIIPLTMRLLTLHQNG